MSATATSLKVLYKVEPAEGQSEPWADFMFWCPGCQCAHGVWVSQRNGRGAVWKFDGDMERPTFEPSIKVTGVQPMTQAEEDALMTGGRATPRASVCHLFVRGGKLVYCGDCTHSFKGRTVDMVRF